VRHHRSSRRRGLSLPKSSAARVRRTCLPVTETREMIEAAKIWNEPNNKSHWDLQLDPDWSKFATLASAAGKAIHSVTPGLPRVLGGISPIDPHFVASMKNAGVLEHMDAVAVHGFPLDWNLWKIDEWPDKIAEIQAVVSLPVWVTEVGVSSFGADEVQEWGV